MLWFPLSQLKVLYKPHYIVYRDFTVYTLTEGALIAITYVTYCISGGFSNLLRARPVKSCTSCAMPSRSELTTAFSLSWWLNTFCCTYTCNYRHTTHTHTHKDYTRTLQHTYTYTLYTYTHNWNLITHKFISRGIVYARMFGVMQHIIHAK